MSSGESIFHLRHWFNGGGSVIPVMERLLDEGEPEYAAVVARLALSREDCSEREAIMDILARIASTPAGWAEALERFAAAPSEERWDELMTFVPLDDLHQRLKYTVAVLQGLGCDADVLFRCVAKLGMIPELYDLAWSGGVSPSTIEERAAGSPVAAAWLGIAAIAAFARGDRFSTVRLLRTACNAPGAELAIVSVFEIRERADEELHAELDRAGVVRLPGVE